MRIFFLLDTFDTRLTHVSNRRQYKDAVGNEHDARNVDDLDGNINASISLP